MDKKDMVIVGLVVLLVLVVAFSSNITTVGNTFKRACSDSDSGSNFIKGTITGTDTSGNAFEMTDYCSSAENQLKEYSCDSDVLEGWKSNIEYCNSGCVDGACV